MKSQTPNRDISLLVWGKEGGISRASSENPFHDLAGGKVSQVRTGVSMVVVHAGVTKPTDTLLGVRSEMKVEVTADVPVK